MTHSTSVIHHEPHGGAVGGPPAVSAYGEQDIELPRMRPALANPETVTSAGFAALLQTLLADPSLDQLLERQPEVAGRLEQIAHDVALRAYPPHRTTDRQSARWIDHAARNQHHRALLAIYQQHTRLPHQGVANQFHPLACRLLRLLEEPWERDTLARAHGRHALSLDALPSDPEAFAEWFRRTAFQHPLYEHELYSFLASEADRQQLEWFLRREAAGEAAFDDMVALGQVGTRGEVKIEMASNYWDEMGNGKSHAVHTHMFHRLVEGLGLVPLLADELPWQVLAGVNVMLWSCIPRRNAFRAQGVLGAVELLAPQRCTRLVHGATRVGIAKRTMGYYGAHAIIDIDHADRWLAHVVRAQVQAVPEARIGIAEGLLVRADASLDYFDCCLNEARALR